MQEGICGASLSTLSYTGPRMTVRLFLLFQVIAWPKLGMPGIGKGEGIWFYSLHSPPMVIRHPAVSQLTFPKGCSCGLGKEPLVIFEFGELLTSPYGWLQEGPVCPREPEATKALTRLGRGTWTSDPVSSSSLVTPRHTACPKWPWPHSHERLGSGNHCRRFHGFQTRLHVCELGHSMDTEQMFLSPKDIFHPPSAQLPLSVGTELCLP